MGDCAEQGRRTAEGSRLFRQCWGYLLEDAHRKHGFSVNSEYPHVSCLGGWGPGKQISSNDRARGLSLFSFLCHLFLALQTSSLEYLHTAFRGFSELWKTLLFPGAGAAGFAPLSPFLHPADPRRGLADGGFNLINCFGDTRVLEWKGFFGFQTVGRDVKRWRSSPRSWHSKLTDFHTWLSLALSFVKAQPFP